MGPFGRSGTQRYLELFRAAGLVGAGADSAPRYAPVEAALAAHVETLALAYEERPVTLFRVICAVRNGKTARTSTASD